jgi:hypothetical protein
MTAKSTVIKGCGCRFGGCAEKVVEITPGGSALCLGDTRLRKPRGDQTVV